MVPCQNNKKTLVVNIYEQSDIVSTPDATVYARSHDKAAIANPFVLSVKSSLSS